MEGTTGKGTIQTSSQLGEVLLHQQGRSSNKEMIYLLAFPAPVSFTIAAVGDVMPGRFVEARIKREGDTKALAGVKSTLKKADLVLGNLECPLTNEPFVLQKPVLLRASPDRAQALKGIFSALSLANNHSHV